jgi:hypothetical protein
MMMEEQSEEDVVDVAGAAVEIWTLWRTKG